MAMANSSRSSKLGAACSRSSNNSNNSNSNNNNTMQNNRLVLLAGSSHSDLADAIAKHLDCTVTRTLNGKFANGETRFELNESLCGANVYIIQTHCGAVNDMFMELLIMVQTCRYAAAERVVAVMPCFPYARQDKMHKFQQPITAKLVANMLATAGVDHVLTVDLHSRQLQGFFDIPCDNLNSEFVIVPWIKRNLPEWREMIIVAPDHGAVKSASSIAAQLGLQFALLHKERRTHNEVHDMLLVGDVRNKTAVVVDDMADTSQTLCFAAQRLMEGGARRIFAIVTHGVFSRNAVDLLNESAYEMVICTNSMPQPAAVLEGKKFHIIDISLFLAHSIRNIHEFRSSQLLLAPSFTLLTNSQLKARVGGK